MNIIIISDKEGFFVELIKKNIHMNKLKCKTDIQLTFDDDFNVPDVKPDIGKIIKEQGQINISEIKAMSGKVMVKGTLSFIVLYISEDGNRPIHNIVGEIPFDEVVNMDEACAEDNILFRWEIEDLTTSIINSRKLSVKSIVLFSFMAEDMYDEETAVGIEGDDTVQYMNKRVDLTQLALNKKDTYRIKDEVNLPSNKANIFEILYSDVSLRNTDIRLLEDKISLKGEILLFILYVGEDEENTIQYIETEVPFSGTIDCNGCREDMISDVDINIHSKDLEIKPDSDGEERVIGFEVILDLDLKAYEDEEIDILSDVYSTSKELIPVVRDAYYENLVMKNNSKVKVVDQVRVAGNEPRILQICNASGVVKIDDIAVVENGLEVYGIIESQILYITEDDNRPMNSIKSVIPFTQLVEIKGINPDSIYRIKPNLEQINVMMLDGEELEVKAIINLNVIVFDKLREPIITDMKVEDINLDKLQEMPSIIGYITKKDDTLWKIAKHYYTTVDTIKEMNGLTQDRVLPGDKLLILKKVDAIL